MQWLHLRRYVFCEEILVRQLVMLLALVLMYYHNRASVSVDVNSNFSVHSQFSGSSCMFIETAMFAFNVIFTNLLNIWWETVTQRLPYVATVISLWQRINRINKCDIKKMFQLKLLVLK